MTHSIIHVEMSSNNHEEMAKFYQDLFGWKFRQIPEMQYATFETGEGVGGGLTPAGDQTPPILIYVNTKDVDGDLRRAEQLGGTIIQPKMEIPGVGWFGIFRDPTGNPIAVMDPIPMPESSTGSSPADRGASAQSG